VLTSSIRTDVDSPTAMPLVSFEGARSKIVEREHHKITDSQSWAKLWLRHVGAEEPNEEYSWFWNSVGVPKIDFDQCVVIAMFAGKAWNSNGFSVQAVDEVGDDLLRLRIQRLTYQTMGPDGGGRRCEPFGIWVLPKTDRTVVLEVNTQGLIGEPPIWTEKARL
ncbi:MAG: hypothetical protein KDB80_13900, partial [Planctomycetes bacterium]|nr:hypothetical protein [Planctomycetota bacterium]